MSNFVEVTYNKLNLEEIVNLVSSPDCGAISTFIGKVKSLKRSMIRYLN